MAHIWMKLRLFGDGGGAGAAPAGDAGTGGEAAVTPGVLEDGTQVDDRLAARLEEQARRRKARGETPVRQIAKAEEPMQAAAQPAEEPQQTEEPSLEDQWNEAKKGKFRELYGRDVQSAVSDRFKNQTDVSAQLEALEPMLKVLREKAGVETNDDLVKHVMDDDSLYEEAAAEAGMTTGAYRNFLQMQAENQKYHEQEKQAEEDRKVQEHLRNLAMQAEDLKKIFPDFDLKREIETNELFKRLTWPGSGVDVKTAYYAVHHDELEPQAMAYGIQRAQQQISQTLQANRQRPVEGAMRTGQPAEISVDPRKMTREERQKYIERARRGETIIF